MQLLCARSSLGSLGPLINYTVSARDREVVIIHRPPPLTRGGQSPVKDQTVLDVAWGRSGAQVSAGLLIASKPESFSDFHTRLLPLQLY